MLRSGVVVASSREDAYALLKRRGIRPSRVLEAPGFFNKLFGKFKRWSAIVLLFFLVVVVSIVAFMQSKAARLHEISETSPLTRRQIYGDPALLESMERSSFRSVFENEGDRYLAFFAQPAHQHVFASDDWQDRMAAALTRIFDTDVVFKEDDAREVRELKRIVCWMRDELRMYLSDGQGTTSLYVRRLVERQNEELAIYNFIVKELEGSRDVELWEKKNKVLRDLGIRTVAPIFSDD